MNPKRPTENENHDPAVLASIIERNRRTLNEGWAELERLTRTLEAMNAQAAKPAQPPAKSPPVVGAAHAE